VTEKKLYREAEVDMADIIVPANIQRQAVDKARIVELAESISRVGLINRIIVRRVQKKCTLIAGYQRYLAHLELKAKTIPARIFDAKNIPDEQLTFDENYHRDDINPVDEALWLARRAELEGLGIEDLARRIGKSKTFISDRLAIVEYDDQIIEALQGGQISVTIAREISRCEDPRERQNILATVCENGATQKVVRYWVQLANMRTEEGNGRPNDASPDQGTSPSYTPPKQFCDLCEHETDYMSSRFIRVCQDCYQLSRMNLSPNKQPT
jgi:ParB family chromosome partitioning protein